MKIKGKKLKSKLSVIFKQNFYQFLKVNYNGITPVIEKEKKIKIKM